MYNIPVIKQLFLIGVMLTGGVVNKYCEAPQSDGSIPDKVSLVGVPQKTQTVEVAGKFGGTANVVKSGSQTPVAGTVPGNGREVATIEDNGAESRVLMVVDNGTSTQLLIVNADGSNSVVTAPAGLHGVSIIDVGPSNTVVTGVVGTTVFFISVPSGKINGTQDISSSGAVAALYTTGDKDVVYVTDKSAAAAYYLVNMSTHSVQAIPSAVSPAGSGKPALTPDGTQLWIPNPAANLITVYDTLSNSLVTTIGLTGPAEVAFTEDGTKAAVISQPSSGPGVIAEVDAKQYVVTGVTPVGVAPVGLSRNPFGTDFWVANSGSGSISNFNIGGTKPTVTETDNIGGTPLGVAVINTFTH